jgi:membrane-bound lytic murein transglycosylase D
MKHIIGLMLLVSLAGCQLTATSPAEQEIEKAKTLSNSEYDRNNNKACSPDPLTHSCQTNKAPSSSLNNDQGASVTSVMVKKPPTPQQVADLWQRIAMQLEFDVPMNERVLARKNWYLKHPEHMRLVAERADPFMHLIVERIEQRGMPLDLALLPIVESSFDPFAYSSGRASGIWQFISSTAKRFGMKQSWWYDGRRDVVASTEGALDFLTYLTERFDGNWLHALAAYNSGEGRVKRAIRQNKKAGKNTDFWTLTLPRETRAYVPKLLALAEILKNAERYQFEFPFIANKAVLTEVDVDSQIDLTLAAHLAEMDVEALHQLNPGLSRWATDPDGPHRLLLPVDKAQNFKSSLAKLEDKKRLNWVRHKVQPGDSLNKLEQRYHTQSDIIQKINNLKNNVIFAGEYLLIPVALQSLDEYGLAADQNFAMKGMTPPGSHRVSYTVRSGDTLWDISRAYNVTIKSLARWNDMAPNDILRPGKLLVIWLKYANIGQVIESENDALSDTVYSFYRVPSRRLQNQIATRSSIDSEPRFAEI